MTLCSALQVKSYKSYKSWDGLWSETEAIHGVALNLEEKRRLGQGKDVVKSGASTDISMWGRLARCITHTFKISSCLVPSLFRDPSFKPPVLSRFTPHLFTVEHVYNLYMLSTEANIHYTLYRTLSYILWRLSFRVLVLLTLESSALSSHPVGTNILPYIAHPPGTPLTAPHIYQSSSYFDERKT